DADSLSGMGPFDGVVANIETGLLLPLIPGLTAAVSGDGWLLLSGILEDELPRVLEALKGWDREGARTDADGEWRSILLQR
ncbi:MAG: 50S ribosomal protein L11 methyltransferase, partial [Longimicrobiales bacterium]|nr:50S ribosomal protein L11 methyltransferase [Longimicrobiales bacterium]